MLIFTSTFRTQTTPTRRVRRQALPLAGLTALLMALSGCGSSDDSPGEVLLTCSVPQIPNAAGTACVAPPPIQCPAPTVPDANNEKCVIGANPDAPMPVVFPTANQTVLFYNRKAVGATNSPSDASYDGYKLHTWNNGSCDAYAPSAIASDWSNGVPITGIDPNYGAYWLLDLKAGFGSCGNFIIHIGTDDAGKEMGGVDQKMPLNQDDPTYSRMNWTFAGNSTIFEYPITDLGPVQVAIKDAAAHWLDGETLVWNAADVTSVKLFHSSDASLKVSNGSLSGDSTELTASALTEAQQAKWPHLASWSAYGVTLSAEQAKTWLTGELVAAGYNSDGELIAATHVQIANVLDALYTQGDNDADEAALGVNYTGSNIVLNLWAPTAQQVAVKLYNADKTAHSTVAMSKSAQTGVWQASLANNTDRLFYRYALTVYHPASGKIEQLESTDPYSLSLSQNGRFSQLVNLADADLKPLGWDGHSVPSIVNPEDAVLYEGHIRDFSIEDASTRPEYRGKYLAFTEQDSAPVQHLRELAASGITHFHLLPSNDIASVNENNELRVELTDTVGKLCQAVSSAPVCGKEPNDKVLNDVLASYLPSGQDAQALVNSIRGVDGFNWGYDPKHFSAPEGSYASVADGVARIVEKRAMVKALHELGLRVVMDVVYNHTSSSGLYDNSVLDKVVPGYYHRLNPSTGAMERSTCCENTATEQTMMAKLMTDSLVMWAQQYGVDGFRFDIMGHIPKAAILAARDAVRAVDADTYFYGEGWNFGEVANNQRFVQAKQADMAGTEVGTYNDRIRDPIREAMLFNQTDNAATTQVQDYIRIGMAGGLKDYVLRDHNGNDSAASKISWNGQPTGYADDPADIINYVSKHDNETLWDKLQLGLDARFDLPQRLRIQNIAATLPLLSQGIPFLQMGGEMLRSKSLDRNSYDAGDWFNKVDFTYQHNNWNVGLPLAQDNQSSWSKMAEIAPDSNKAASMTDIMQAHSVFSEYLQIRKASPLLRLTNKADIMARVGFHNVGKKQTAGVIVMSIDDGVGVTDLDPAVDALVVVVNATEQSVSHTVPTASGFSLHSVLQQSVDSTVRSASFAPSEQDANNGTFTVPALTTAVFVKRQGDSQGAGLAANATVGKPDVVPYGSTVVYLRGDMNGWGESQAFSYQGAGIYQTAVSLTAGSSYGFKVASSDWSTVNFGAENGSSASVSLDGSKALFRTNDNLSFTAIDSALYRFTLDASNPEAPVLTVSYDEPFYGSTVLLRGGMNGWSESDAFVYQGNSQYQFTRQLTAGSYEFKVASSDWSTVNFGAVSSGEADVSLAEAKTLARTNDNLKLTIASDALYTFIFDARNKAAPVLTVYPAQTFDSTDVFIRGSLNGWGTSDLLQYSAPGQYQFSKALTAGDYEFKVASSDWATVNLGAKNGDEAQVTVGSAKPLFNSNDNLKLSIASDGNYRFTVSGFSTDAMTVTVTAEVN